MIKTTASVKLPLFIASHGGKDLEAVFVAKHADEAGNVVLTNAMSQPISPVSGKALQILSKKELVSSDEISKLLKIGTCANCACDIRATAEVAKAVLEDTDHPGFHCMVCGTEVTPNTELTPETIQKTLETELQDYQDTRASAEDEDFEEEIASEDDEDLDSDMQALADLEDSLDFDDDELTAEACDDNDNDNDDDDNDDDDEDEKKEKASTPAAVTPPPASQPSAIDPVASPAPKVGSEVEDEKPAPTSAVKANEAAAPEVKEPVAETPAETKEAIPEAPAVVDPAAAPEQTAVPEVQAKKLWNDIFGTHTERVSIASGVDWANAVVDLVKASLQTPTYYVFANGEPVAKLVQSKADPELSDIFNSDTFVRAFLTSAKNGLSDEDQKRLGFDPIVSTVSVKRHLKDKQDTAVAQIKEEAQVELANFKQKLLQSFNIALLASLKGTFKDLDNPFRDALSAELARLGVKGPEGIIDSVFATHGVETFAKISAKAEELCNKPDNVRDELCSVVENATFKSGVSRSVVEAQLVETLTNGSLGVSLVGSTQDYKGKNTTTASAEDGVNKFKKLVSSVSRRRYN